VGSEALKGLSKDELWQRLILLPEDYSDEAIFEPERRAIMETISFVHGGKEYDERYPDGIPTSVVLTDQAGKTHDSGLVMYPAGHARNTTADLIGILKNKFRQLALLTVSEAQADRLLARLENLAAKSAAEILSVYSVVF
jgi:2-methylcitrate dehydratase